MMPDAMPATTQWNEVTRHLRPRLRSDAWLDRRQLAARHRGQALDTSFLTLAPDLHLSLVVDEEDRMLGVDQEALDSWGVSFDRAAQTAIGNLRRRSDPPYIELAPGLWLAPFEDGYASSRLLCAPPLAHRLVAAIPDRDTLLLADPSHPRALEALSHAAEAIDPETPLTERLYHLKPGRIESIASYQLPSDHPAASLVERRLIAERIGRYQEQRGPLQQVVGDGVYVASAQLARRPSAGGLGTFALWAEPVRTLLPEVDDVHLLETGAANDQRLWVASFERLRELPGAIERTDCKVARWRTARFPSSAELHHIAMPAEKAVAGY
jgi:hypothetical protein